MRGVGEGTRCHLRRVCEGQVTCLEPELQEVGEEDESIVSGWVWAVSGAGACIF